MRKKYLAKMTLSEKQDYYWMENRKISGACLAGKITIEEFKVALKKLRKKVGFNDDWQL